MIREIQTSPYSRRTNFHATKRAARVHHSVNFDAMLQRALRGAIPASLLVASAAAACFSPELSGGECLVSCTEGCPPDWQCKEERCVSPHFQGSCSNETPGASGGRTATEQGGAGGAPSAPSGGQPDSGGTADIATGGGAAVEGGSSGEGGVGSGALAVNGTVVGVACTGQPATIQVEASGGEEPYAFELEQDDCGFALAADGGSSAQLVADAVTGESCTLVVVARDSAGGTGRASLSFIVHETPHVVNEMLPPACALEEYGVPLSASGGNADDYRFHAELPEAGNWSVEDATLTGTATFTAAQEISIWVEDGYCESPHTSLSLALEPETSEQCPNISSAREDGTLPVPCAGMEYHAALSAKYVASWEPLQLPPNFELKPDPSDPSELVLSGQAEGSTGKARPIRLRVRSAADRSAVFSYSLPPPREKCWLGYVSRQSGSWQLNLFDPELVTRRQFQLDSSAAVTSFAFSPDGAFVVYESVAPDAPNQLTLVNLSNLDEQPLLFAGSIESYSWSEDGSLLGVVVSKDGENLLTGVRVDMLRGAAVGVLGSTSYLEPSPFYGERGFTWFGAGSIAYPVTDLVPTRFTIERREWLGDGFSEGELLELGSYQNTLQILGFAGGFLANDDAHLDFYSRETAPTTSLARHAAARAAFSPSGRYVASVASSQLEVFAATSEEPLPASDSDCGALLAWSSTEDKVACIRNTEGGGEIRLFSVQQDGERLAPPSVLPGDYKGLYFESSAEQRRRLFSPRGRYFAFTTDDALYVADQRSAGNFRSYSPWGAPGPETGARIELAFSSDERFIAQQRGTALTVHELAGTDRHALSLASPDPMPPPAPCNEQYMGHADAWCGAPLTPRDFRWSPHAPLIAFKTASGLLNVIELVDEFETRDRLVVNPDCSGDCVQDFAFQP